MKRLLIPMLVITAYGEVLFSRVSEQTATGKLTIEQLIDIRHPSSPMWAPDGRHVAFVWDRAGVSGIYVVDASTGSTPPRELEDAGSVLAGAFWSADGGALMIAKNGDLWRVPIDGGAASAIWTTPQAESNIVPSPDRTRVAFVRPASQTSEGRPAGVAELRVRSLSDGREVLITRANEGIGNLSWSPDGQSLVYTAGARTIRHEQTPAYSGSKIIYTINENVPGETMVVPMGDVRRQVQGGSNDESAARTPKLLPAARGGFGARRWLDARHILVDRTSPDFKGRTTSLVDVVSGEAKVLNEDVEEKFWSMPGDAGAGSQPSPDGKWIAFLSDRDGWDHLYVMPAAGGNAVQITKGRFEAWRPAWSPDSMRIAFDANVPDRFGTRHLYIATLNGNPSRATITAITAGRGTNIAPLWSPDGTRLVYQHTDPHNPADLWTIEAKPDRRPVRLTDSMPAAMDRSQFVEPETVHYAGPDGQKVPAWLFVPKDLDRSRKHPAVVWIHGDGVNQSYDGWHVQRNYAVYYSFHQYLLQQGYVVIAPDYRGSIGYGRAWREGVYMDVGGRDAKDAWMAANYLKALPYVDGDRLGVWGLSYGGFFTLIAVTDQPKLYRAAVNVAGVADYAMYYEDPYHGAWTTSRIGTPDQNPQVYAQASPLSRVDRLERPLLVLHGTSDVNVPFLHSVRLVDELLKKGKGHLVSFMTYPGEFHYFTREHVLRDAWHRVKDFFDAHLKTPSMTSH
jgi:dipeptidyl aminopeptidase/acylaminoacyl peptidase